MKGSIPLKAVLNAVCVVLCIISVYPLIIMFMDAFKSISEISSNPAGLPQNPSFNNFRVLFAINGGLVLRTFFNTIFIGVTSTFLILALAAMAAFAFAKYKFAGKNVIFVALLMTMMIPGELAIPPLYIMFSKMHWINTYTVQIVPGAASVFSMFLITQYLQGVPSALIESARIDGAGHFKIFANIILPVILPILSALMILNFLGSWNAYLWPSIMVRDMAKWPVSVLLPRLNDNRGSSWIQPWDVITACSTLITVPIIIVFFIFNKKVMDSVIVGAIKE